MSYEEKQSPLQGTPEPLEPPEPIKPPWEPQPQVPEEPEEAPLEKPGETQGPPDDD